MSDPRELLDAYAAEYQVTRGRREVHAPEAFAALRAVLELHPPRLVPCIYPGKPGLPYCDTCDRVWPCPTVQAIAGELEGNA